MTLQLGGGGAITGCTLLQEPVLIVSGITVNGDLDAPKVRVGPGTEAAPSYTFSGDTDTGLYLEGTNSIGVSTNGTNAILIDSTGNVGIGTTSPNNNLEVVAAADGSDAALISLRNAGGTNSSATLRFVNSTSPLGAAKAEITAIRNASAGTDLVFKRQSNLESFRVDSSGNLGIGTTSPGSYLASAHQLVISDSASTGITIATPTSSSGTIAFADGTGAADNVRGLIRYGHSDNSLQFGTNATERLRIDSAGRLLVGLSSSIGGNALLQVQGSGNRKAHFHQPDTGQCLAQFTNSVTGTGTTDGFLVGLDSTEDGMIWQLENQNLIFGTADTERMRIDSAGRVGIGNTNPADYSTVSKDLVVGNHNGARGITIAAENNNTGYLSWADGTSTVAEQRAGRIAYSHADSSMRFDTAANESMRIDSAGKLLVGTTSEVSDSSHAKIQAASSGGGSLALGRDDSSVASGNDIGLIRFYGNDGGSYQECARISTQADASHSNNNKPSRLVFSTTKNGESSPTGRAQIDNTGRLYTFSAAAGEGPALMSAEGAGTTYQLFGGWRSAANVLGQAAVNVFRVYTNGNTQNTNNSYTGISDIKLKENVVDASSQWLDIKLLQVRKYNFKKETGHQTHTQIGLIAQEVELVSPELVNESPDRDAEGNDLGTTTKSVNYSVLYMKAVKALQEAMERIETLEQRLTDAGL